MEISVCSWSYRLSAARVAEEMAKGDVKNVHLALNPFVDPLAVVPGTAGETENVAGTGGVDSLDKQRADIESYLASGRWKENRKIIADVVKLTAEWKSPYMMLHAGYINPSDKAGHAKLTDRLKCVRDLCADAGIGLTLETGQETADDLAEMLTNLPGVYVNFDPANMVLYGKGDPVKAVKTLAPWIRHIHVKDANYTKVPGTWGEEVAWTRGQVNADAFIAALREIGFDGCLAVEREAGDDRPGDIARAVEDLHRRGF